MSISGPIYSKCEKCGKMGRQEEKTDGNRKFRRLYCVHYMEGETTASGAPKRKSCFLGIIKTAEELGVEL